MKCLNKSLPVIQDALKVIGSEPALIRIMDEVGDGANLHQILSAYRRFSRPAPTSEVMKRVYLFLDRIGVDVQKVRQISVEGVKYDAAAIADFTNRLIQYTEGHEDMLVEEAIHFAIEILEQTNPDLFNRMLKEIGSFDIYTTTLNTYKTNPKYQTKDGKPDIRKIKKEAIAKKLVDILIDKVENDTMAKNMKLFEIWQNVVEWFKNLFKTAGFNPFDEAVVKILNDQGMNLTTDIKMEGVMFSLNEYPAQDRLVKRFKEVGVIVDKRSSEEGYFINGVRQKRVTDIVKEWYSKIFGEGDIEKKEYNQLLNEIRKEGGTAGHADLEYAASRLVDESGLLRPTPLDDTNYTPKTNRAIYDALKTNLQKRMARYPEGTKFLFETKVYNGKDMAGTIDFIAITRTGKVSILDWKFMDLDVEKYTDVPWYKKKAFRMQINEYKKILQENYGVSAADFQDVQAIPIKAYYTNKRMADGTFMEMMTNVTIGDVNVKIENRDYLLPIGLEEMTTGDKNLDALVIKLTGLREVLELKVAKTPKEKFDKAQQLNAIERALRYMQVKQSIIPLIDQALIFTEELDRLFTFYATNLKDRDLRGLSTADIADFGIKLNRAFDEIEIYTNLDVELESFFADVPRKDREKLMQRLSTATTQARKLKSRLINITNEFGEKVGNTVGMRGLTDPEVTVTGNRRLFISTSKLQMKTLQTLYYFRREAQNKMDYATDEENRQLVKIRQAYMELAKKMNWGNKEMYDILVKKGTNKLIDQYQARFYEEAKESLRKKDYNWIQENIDVEAYRAEISRKLSERLEFISQKVFVGDTKAEKMRQMNKEISDAKRDFDLSKPDSKGWYGNYLILRNFPKEGKWESAEWKQLTKPENKPAKDLYDWIVRVNAKANESGYLPANAAERNFLPYVPKSWSEKVVFGGKTGLMEEIIKSVTVDADTTNMGQIDKLNGKFINRVPVFFTRETDKELSTNLFENLALYNESVNRYTQISEIEGIALALGRLERNKKSIVTSFWGQPSYDADKKTFNVVSNNEQNASLYDKQVATLIYGKKYIDSAQWDLRMGSVNKAFSKFNKVLGKDIFPTDMKDRTLSVNKSVETLTDYFQMKALGLNPLSALSNLLGGHFTGLINSGRLMSKTDFLKSEMELTSNTFSDKETSVISAAIRYFMPFTDDMNRDLMLDELTSGKGKLTGAAFQQLLFFFMRKGDRFIQSALFLSILRNQIVIDGRLVNARDYLREQPEYKRRYENPAQLEAIENSFEEKVADLIKQYGVFNVAKVENGELVIPGVDRNSDQVFAVRNITREMTKKTLGNLSPEEIRGVQQNIWLRGAMLFKNWIPDSIDVRFGTLKFNAATDQYEWGRARTLIRHFAVNGLRGLREFGTVLGAELLNSRKEVSFESLESLYNYKMQDYFMKTGQTLQMSEEDFKDMVRQNLRNMAKDIIYNLTGLAMYFNAIATAPADDDEDKYAKNMHKFMVRLIDKFTDELAFYYSPAALGNLLNTDVFPAWGLVETMYTALSKLLYESWAITVDDEEEEKKTHVIKYFLKLTPVGSQFASYLPLFAPDLAKDLGIILTTESRANY